MPRVASWHIKCSFADPSDQARDLFAKSMFYDLSVNTWGREELDAIQRVIASDRFTIGPNVAAFEEAFASYHNRRYAVMTNSGSSANLLCVAALFYKKDRPLERGDEIIVPAISWATTYHPLQQYGLKLVILDVELETINVDVSQLERALGPRTRAIMGVSILGNPAALDVMRRFADEHQLYFIEDNCESMDAELDGRKAGTFGHLSTFSSFFSHHISTMEGGMITTDDRELFELAKSMRAHGWVRDLPDDSIIFEKGLSDFYEAYRFILPGYNVRPIEMSGAIGVEQLKKLPGMTERRRQNWQLFRRLFENDDRFVIQRENGKSSAFCFTIIANSRRGVSRTGLLAALKKADIGYRMITGGCITRHDVIRHYDHRRIGGLPNANAIHDQGFFVGNHPIDLTPQIHRLRAVLDHAAGS
jgi:CDP-4-dehydro-6-deoxyglucose reductase, E1